MATPQSAEPKRKVLVAPSMDGKNTKRLALAGIAAIISVAAHAVLILLMLNLDLSPANAGSNGEDNSAPIIDDEKATTKSNDIEPDKKPADKGLELIIDITRPDIGDNSWQDRGYELPKLDDFNVSPMIPMPDLPDGIGTNPASILETNRRDIPPPPGSPIGAVASPDGTAPFLPNINGSHGPAHQNPFQLARTPGSTRDIMRDQNGGNKESDAMVARGLQFLANHQALDGHWSMNEFDRQLARKQVKKANGEVSYVYAKDKSDPGTRRQNDIAGTAFGLLPFLGAGQTQNPVKDSKFDYSKNVKAGLHYLIRQQEKNKDGYYGGDMYAHAIATIAMCEAYGLTSDNALMVSAERAIHYIENTQGAGGGWRYDPKADPGDTSVTGWQLMALKSGQMAGLTVKKETIKKVEKYLDSCESINKGGYSYLPGGGEIVSMTAVGLLCRQYLGVNPRNPDLLKGVQRLEATTPGSNHNIYYLYYATQVMHHMGGDNWKAWNLGPKEDGKGGIRDTLISLMDKGATNPDTDGSWMLPGGDGRLMSTSLALLTLEVYYRHLPLYRRDVGQVKVAP